MLEKESKPIVVLTVVALVTGTFASIIGIMGWWGTLYPPPPPPRPVLVVDGSDIRINDTMEEGLRVVDSFGVNLTNQGTAPAIDVQCSATIYKKSGSSGQVRIDTIDASLGFLHPGKTTLVDFTTKGTKMNRSDTPREGYPFDIDCLALNSLAVTTKGCIYYGSNPPPPNLRASCG